MPDVRHLEKHQWTVRLLRAGAFRLDGGAMFGIIPKALWQRSTPPDEDNRIPLQTNCLLLENGDGRRVLVETGYGDKFDEKNRSIFAMEDRSIVNALNEIKVDPADITDVIVTHLHFDHAGGLTRRRNDSSDVAVPTFPNATIHVQQREWEDAIANKSTMSKTYLREHLDPVRDRVRLIDGPGEPVPGILVEPVPGHTWGQQAVLFHDADGPCIFPGDVMPTAQHAGLPFNMAYDVEPYTNMQTKRRLMERAVDEHWRWIIDHEPGDPIVRVQRKEGGRPDAFELVDSTDGLTV